MIQDLINLDVAIHPLKEDFILQSDISLKIARLDNTHQHISGNKWFKLKYNLEYALKNNYRSLVSYGGAYSNHLTALAYAGKKIGIQTCAFIRGEKSNTPSETIAFLEEQEMQLHFISRSAFKEIGTNDFRNKYSAVFDNAYEIPMGGCNELGIKGCKEIKSFIKEEADVFAVACGTGATLAGIILSLRANESAIGFQSMKGEHYLESEIQKLVPSNYLNWSVSSEYHFGGFGKIKSELTDFMNSFYRKHGVMLDYVYTGKMMFGLYKLIRSGHFEPGTKIIALHTGGLQGNQLK